MLTIAIAIAVDISKVSYGVEVTIVVALISYQ